MTNKLQEKSAHRRAFFWRSADHTSPPLPSPLVPSGCSAWDIFAILTFATAWLVPNHYLPWPSFWNEAVAALGGTFLTLGCVHRLDHRLQVSAVTVAAIALATVPLIQCVFGQIFFSGDAFVASFYLLGFGLVVAAINAQRASAAHDILNMFAGAILFASVLSIGIAAYQWLGLTGLQIFASDAPPGSRPYANIGQPNHLATLLVLGLASAVMFYQQQLIGIFTLWMLASWLIVGVAMTQSRTAGLAMLVWIIWVGASSRRASIRVGLSTLIGMGAIYGALVLCWPAIGELLFVPAARSLVDQSDPGVRIHLWKMLTRAAWEAPWFGYGWNQVSVAQAAVASGYDGPSVATEHSHNLVLDLMLWCGIPLGLAISFAVGFWIFKRCKASRDPLAALSLGAVAVVLVHAMLEYPIEYAYFLLPVAVWIGYVERQSPGRWSMAVPRKALFIATIAAGALLGRIVYEYIAIEQDNRNLRFEMAGYAGATARSDVPVLLLTQLQEFPAFARSRASRNMPPDQLERMRKMSERYAFPPILFRYALALALNGRQTDASRVLATLCKLHPAERCREGIDTWKDMAATSFPEIEATRLPAVPIQ